MKLRKLVERYHIDHDVTPETQAGYRTTVRLFDRWNGKPVKAKHLSDSLINELTVNTSGLENFVE